MSTLPTKMTTGQEFLMKVVDSFISWLQWKASLSLTTQEGKGTFAFSTTLGRLTNPLK